MRSLSLCSLPPLSSRMPGCAFSLSFLLLLVFVPSIAAQSQFFCLIGEGSKAVVREVSLECTFCFVATRYHPSEPNVTMHGCMRHIGESIKPFPPRACVLANATYSYTSCARLKEACNRKENPVPAWNYGHPCQPSDMIVVRQFKRNYTGSVCANTVFNAQCKELTRYRTFPTKKCADMCWSNASHVHCSFGVAQDAGHACLNYKVRSSSSTASTGLPTTPSTANIGIQSSSTDSIEYKEQPADPRNESAAERLSSIFEKPEYIAVVALAILLVVLLVIIGLVCWIRQKRKRNALKEAGASSLASKSSGRSQGQTPEGRDKSTPQGGTPVSSRRSEKETANKKI